MKPTVLPADAAQIDTSGKVNALGLGWDQIPTAVPGMALVIFVHLEPEDQTGESITIDGTILDSAGEPARFGPENKKLRIGAIMEVTKETTRATAVLALGPGLQLAPGPYRWSFRVESMGAATEYPFTVLDVAHPIPGTPESPASPSAE